jgi:hypothetical protein
VEYIQCNSGAYIDTLIKNTSNVKFNLEFTLPVYNNGYWFFGSRVSGTSKALGFFTYQDGGYSRYYFGANNQSASQLQAGRYVLDNENSRNVLRVNGINYITVTSSSWTSDLNFYLFTLNNNGSTANPGDGLCFHCGKIWSSGNLVRDYIPVRKNRVGYLYDKVSGELFGNANSSGSFTYGNDVNS